LLCVKLTSSWIFVSSSNSIWCHQSLHVQTNLLCWINWTNLMSLYDRSAPTCIPIPPYSSRTAPIHQYTPKQSSTPTDSHQLLKMNVIAFETCWTIKNFHEVISSWFNLFNFGLFSQAENRGELTNKLVIQRKYSVLILCEPCCRVGHITICTQRNVRRVHKY